jgi:FlaA1/EpsC-like NDP-sugar epimerase
MSRRKPLHILLPVYHPLLFAASLVGAFLLRFDLTLPAEYHVLLMRGLLFAVPLKIVVFLLHRLSVMWWRHVGILDLLRIFRANLTASAGFAVLGVVFIGPAFPRSIYFLDFLLCFSGTAGASFLVRLYDELRVRVRQPGKARKRILIYGAGAAGIALAREVRHNSAIDYSVVGFLDDDLSKIGATLTGLRVLGSGRDAAAIVDRLRLRKAHIDEVVIAMPSANGRQMRDAIANCRAAGVPCKTIPGIGELLEGHILSAQIRNVSVTDLLGRDPVQIEEARILDSVRGRPVMVTGAAGSIGSELCRQLAGFQPAKLVAFDQAESDLFRIDAELRERFPNLNVVPVLGDLRHPPTLVETIRRHEADVIFHAAAYKHVPMIEAYPLEALRNNVLGTWNLIQAAYQAMVPTFVMISSDKAVNPSSIMGTTKRVAELLLSGMPDDRTRFVAVRFGNVLGSNGSVIPTFQAQIARGGPVTITHPEIRRYFMTIREAVQLVLLASTMGARSEVFVLDMGEPVRIVDLAKQMIRLAGLKPDKDIEIRYVGLRPGEKLSEELVMESETLGPTSHKKLRVLQGPKADGERNRVWIAELTELLNSRDVPRAVAHLRTLVPQYQPPGEAAVEGRARKQVATESGQDGWEAEVTA